ncbi:MAG: MATE family efflux transporter [Bacteroidaceae bacterium]|nr:MATE family efflux transporter [Bacteroidaceae bacterium]
MTLSRRIWAIALPSIATNITVPLLGLVDTAITGHLGATAYIGAVAVGGMMFNMVYWLLGFLRMTTSGLTAQAQGAGDDDASDLARHQSLTWGLLFGLLMVVLQGPLLQVLLYFYAPTGGVADGATTYFRILVWGAPAVLAVSSLSGWFLGRQDARSPMVTAVAQNVVNIAASLVLVLGCGLKIEGVALGTLVAQWAGLGVALFCYYRKHARRPLLRLRLRGCARFFSVSRDIFLRTVCLVAVLSWFTRTGTAFGEVTLATNAVLMEFFVVTSYFLDGFAYAGEAVSGSLLGAGDRAGLHSLIRSLSLISAATALVFTLVFLVGGDAIVALLTDRPEVRRCATDFLPYLVAVPLVSFAAFLFDGVFVGCTATRPLLWSVVAGSAAFFLILYSLPSLANHGLWLAFLAFLLLRGLVLTAAVPALLRRV